MRNATTRNANGLSFGIFQGFRAADGRFDEDRSGPKWVAFKEPEDIVFWRPSTGEIATDQGRAFALNEAAIDAAGSYCLDSYLFIHNSVTSWIRAGGEGIFIVNWGKAFEKLRHAPRLEIEESLQNLYRRSMQPIRMPTLKVRRSQRSVAA